MSNCRRADCDSGQLRRLRDAHALAQLGDGAFYVTSAAYLVRLGWSLDRVGILLGLCWGAGALLSRVIGRLADRHGLVRTSAAAVGGCAAGLLGLALAGEPTLVAAAFLVYALGQSTWGGLRAALVQVTVAPAAAVAARARLQAIGNGAVAAGAAAGGLSLALGPVLALRIVVGLDAALYLTAAVLIGRGIRIASPARPAPGERPEPVADSHRLTQPQLVATIAAAAFYLYMPMLGVAVPLMITRTPGIPDWTISACFLANTVGVMALQRRAASAVTTASGARRALASGGILLAISSALLWTSLHASLAAPALIGVGLGAGVVTQVLGEVRFAAGSWDLGYRLAPARGAAGWQVTYGAAIPVARSVGPAILAPLAAAPAGWIAPAALFLAGATAMVTVATTNPAVTHPAVPNPTGSAA